MKSRELCQLLVPQQSCRRHAAKGHGGCREQRGGKGTDKKEGLPLTMWEGRLKEGSIRAANTSGEEVPEPVGGGRRKQGSRDVPQTVVAGGATKSGGGRCCKQGQGWKTGPGRTAKEAEVT